MKAPKSEKSEGREQLRNIARYSGLGIQMAAMVGLGAYLGSWLDEKYPSNRKWFTLAGVLISVTVSMVYVLRQLNRSNKS